MIKHIILVSVGIFQEYILTNIEQLVKLGFKIHVITDKVFFSKLDKFDKLINLVDAVELNIDYFNNNSKLDKGFRNGFWNNASKRLFLVYEYIRVNRMKNILHLENDVLLYSKMNFTLDNKIYLTMDAENRCIPGILYIPNSDLMKNLIEKYDFNKNDMINMSNFYHNNRDKVNTFPIINDSIEKCIYNEKFEEFSSIFDAAAIGQYLGGVDPRNIPGDTSGFINETCVIKYNKYKFKWIKKEEYLFPHIEINGKLIPINNLHIHSKNLKRFNI